jgi:hypothetical protein
MTKQACEDQAWRQSCAAWPIFFLCERGKPRMRGLAGWRGCVWSSLVVVAMLASWSSRGSMVSCRDNSQLPSVRACLWCRTEHGDHLLRLRGGKAGRRTQPAKVPEQFWTKRYQADWDKLKLRDKRVHDPERGLSRTEFVKLPGSYWAFGQRLPDRAPNMTVGRDISYEDAHLKSGAMLFHPDTMEPLNPNRIFGDPDDPWHELRWDPRDIDEEVRKRMDEPDKYHPYIKMVLRYRCENDAFRVRAAREAVNSRLFTHSLSSPAGGGSGAGCVRVPLEEPTVQSALLRLRSQQLQALQALSSPAYTSSVLSILPTTYLASSYNYLSVLILVHVPAGGRGGAAPRHRGC